MTTSPQQVTDSPDTIAAPLKASRRQLLKGSACLAALSPWLSACSTSSDNNPSDPWNQLEAIRARIQPPTFADQDFLITAFGAISGKEHDASVAIQSAINACHQAGGGRVVVPAGEFYCGPLVLKSNVNLHLQQDATLRFYPEPERYVGPVFTRWEGTELMGNQPLIYAYQQQNIAITGKGTLDGMADKDHWWPWTGEWSRATWTVIPEQQAKFTKEPLREMADAGVEVSDRQFSPNYLRPPFIQPYDCDNVLIEGVTIRNSPFWLIHPVLCRNVTVSGVTCISHGPNSDGCDPESCSYVLIKDCLFDTGDDCIAIKSGRDADGRRVNMPCENVIIENCLMKEGHGGVVIGSEISGGVRNVFAQNCQMSSPDLERGIRIKTNALRGGHLANLHYRNITIGQVKDAVVINFHYEKVHEGPFDPVLENISIDNLLVEHAQRAFMLDGLEAVPIRGVSLTNLTFKRVEKDNIVRHVAELTQDNIVINQQPVRIEV